MSEAELKRVEKALELNLPDDYRRLMLYYGRGGDNFYAPNGYLFSSGDTVIERTEWMRGTPGIAEDDIVVGETGDGDSFTLRPSISSTGLWWIDHETGEVKRKLHETLWPPPADSKG